MQRRDVTTASHRYCVEEKRDNAREHYQRPETRRIAAAKRQPERQQVSVGWERGRSKRPAGAALACATAGLAATGIRARRRRAQEVAHYNAEVSATVEETHSIGLFSEAVRKWTPASAHPLLSLASIRKHHHGSHGPEEKQKHAQAIAKRQVASNPCAPRTRHVIQ